MTEPEDLVSAFVTSYLPTGGPIGTKKMFYECKNIIYLLIKNNARIKLHINCMYNSIEQIFKINDRKPHLTSHISPKISVA